MIRPRLDIGKSLIQDIVVVDSHIVVILLRNAVRFADAILFELEALRGERLDRPGWNAAVEKWLDTPRLAAGTRKLEVFIDVVDGQRGYGSPTRVAADQDSLVADYWFEAEEWGAPPTFGCSWAGLGVRDTFFPEEVGRAAMTKASGG